MFDRCLNTSLTEMFKVRVRDKLKDELKDYNARSVHYGI